MGTDYLELLDRITAEMIIRADEADLICLVESRTTRDGPPVWKNYWNAEQDCLIDFPRATTATERLKLKSQHGTALEEIKDDLLREMCVSAVSISVDYWGCWADVFAGKDPADAIPWEDFTAPIRRRHKTEKEEWETSGRYLLTDENVDSILRSLEAHKNELTIMGEPEITHLRLWQTFCRRVRGFCIVYQIDF
ncbi:MAG TPA: hypothetical protein VKE93_20990 [Candidatus Angelobacter sp.]|nr:hypothetical protein [Candidatus Angelobacter sp.]